MFKRLALTNNGLASTLFEPWSQYMPQAGRRVQWEQGGFFAGSICFVWLFFRGYFISLFFFLKGTTSVSLFKI